MSLPSGGGDAPAALRFDLHYDEPLMRRLALERIRRQLGVGYLLAMLLASVGLVSMLVEGDRSWVVGMVAAVVAMGVLVPVLGWRAQLTHSLATLRRLDPPVAHVVADDALRFESSAGSMVVRWSDLTRVLVLREAWILFAGQQHVTIPLAGLDAATREAFASRLRTAGLELR